MPTGYLHLKDVLYADESARSVPVPPWRVRALAVVGPQDEVEDALAAMQRSGAHLARVDEDGRTVGVVFLEDILEELVGEVRDAMQRASCPDRWSGCGDRVRAFGVSHRVSPGMSISRTGRASRGLEASPRAVMVS